MLSLDNRAADEGVGRLSSSSLRSNPKLTLAIETYARNAQNSCTNPRPDNPIEQERQEANVCDTKP